MSYRRAKMLRAWSLLCLVIAIIMLPVVIVTRDTTAMLVLAIMMAFYIGLIVWIVRSRALRIMDDGHPSVLRPHAYWRKHEHKD